MTNDFAVARRFFHGQRRRWGWILPAAAVLVAWTLPLAGQQAPSAPVPAPAPAVATAGAAAQAANGDQATPPPQPKRILGIMPNFRAVSAGAHPPPPTPKQSFAMATQNSFDYSAFVFVGVTSGLAEWSNAHPQLGEGAAGFGRYYWRGFLDKTDGNYLVTFAMPSVLHEDERYYALGKGGVWKRSVYSFSRIFITPDYHGNDTFNASELLGRGLAQVVSRSYYPSAATTAHALAVKFGYALLRDGVTDTFREFWPDIAVHLLHRNP